MNRVEAPREISLGLYANLAQFTLLVIVNAFVGAMVGMERSILPAIAEGEFHLAARTEIADRHVMTERALGAQIGHASGLFDTARRTANLL